jgi:hypothetical protein
MREIRKQEAFHLVIFKPLETKEQTLSESESASDGFLRLKKKEKCA